MSTLRVDEWLKSIGPEVIAGDITKGLFVPDGRTLPTRVRIPPRNPEKEPGWR